MKVKKLGSDGEEENYVFKDNFLFENDVAHYRIEC